MNARRTLRLRLWEANQVRSDEPRSKRSASTEASSASAEADRASMEADRSSPWNLPSPPRKRTASSGMLADRSLDRSLAQGSIARL